MIVGSPLKLAGIAACAALALTAGVFAAAWWFGAEAPEPLPEFALADLSGETRRASEWRGEVVVLNFWATWCKPCREETPMLVALQDELGDQGLQLVGLAVDEPEPVRRFAAEYGVDYPMLVDAAGALQLQTQLGGGDGLPFTAVIDRDGQVQAKIAGAVSRTQLLAVVKPLLATQ